MVVVIPQPNKQIDSFKTIYDFYFYLNGFETTTNSTTTTNNQTIEQTKQPQTTNITIQSIQVNRLPFTTSSLSSRFLTF